MKPKVAVLFTSGTNCDYETSLAIELAGGDPETVHTSELRNSRKIETFQMLVIPGGFSYGDHLGSATVWSNELKDVIGSRVQKFLNSGKLIMGICNGFQVLVKLGIVPNTRKKFISESSLTANKSGNFEGRWVNLFVNPKTTCVFTYGLESIHMPVAHGEGKFLPKDLRVFGDMIKNEQVVLQYADNQSRPTMNYPANPNGSFASIAGVCDISGRAFGLMPHPERFLFKEQERTGFRDITGLSIYKNAINYFK